MGLIGLLITMILMVLAAGYFLFAGPKSAFTVTNDASAPMVADGLSRYADVRQQVLDAKNLVEQKAADTMETADEPKTETAVDENPIQAADGMKIIQRLMSSGFMVAQQARSIDTIVLHSSYDLAGTDPYSVSGIVKEYEDYGVSAHYLIDRAGKIYRLVADQNIAYHAGVSRMPDGRTDVNDFSIGIEMMNTETGQLTKAQYAAINDLVSYLKKRHPITSVVGHSDIAPSRKTDPWNFDWKKLK
ncbi:MAG: N-acetylmuramoyl-L-alanine amidase [Candidatus Moraniibacteriota bacterium]